MTKPELHSITEDLVDNNGRKRKMGIFNCKCGKTFKARIDQVNSGNTTSCGCHRLQRLRETACTFYKNGDIINGSVFIEEIIGDKIRKVKVLCKHCGNIFITGLNALKSNHTQSCGCYKDKLFIDKITTHGKHDTREYRIWQHMKSRCTNVNNDRYSHYGGRGITVCDKWLLSFEDFYKDMGDAPTKKHSIDRIDNDKGYCKENCRWATNAEQSRNKRDTIMLTYKGITKPLASFIESSGVCRNTVSDRLKKGWHIERAFDYKIKI